MYLHNDKGTSYVHCTRKGRYSDHTQNSVEWLLQWWSWWLKWLQNHDAFFLYIEFSVQLYLGFRVQVGGNLGLWFMVYCWRGVAVLGDEGWNLLTGIINFCILNRPKKNSNSTQIILGFLSRQNVYNLLVRRHNSSWVKDPAPAFHLAISFEGYSRR